MEIVFHDVLFNQYILSETQILNRPNILEAEKSTRIYLMNQISKLNEKLGFNKSKELYREVLNAGECTTLALIANVFSYVLSISLNWQCLLLYTCSLFTAVTK